MNHVHIKDILRSRRFLSIFQAGRSSKRESKRARKENGESVGRKGFIVCPTLSPCYLLFRTHSQFRSLRAHLEMNGCYVGYIKENQLKEKAVHLTHS